MNRLGKAYTKKKDRERAIKNYKTQVRSQDYETNERRAKAKEAVKLSRQIQKQVGNSKAGRALMGAVYGFNTGIAPLSYSKKAADLGFKTYTPTAAAVERGDTSKKTAAFNKRLESSKTFRTWNTIGNIGATALSFIGAGGITKGLANKALKTGAAKKLTGRIAEKATQKALRDTAGKGLTRKILSRIAQNSGRKVTETSIRNAAKGLTNKIAENVAQDVASDATVGLYRDLASARANGVDLKDAKQTAKYLGKQALINTAIGAVTNGVAPVAGALKKSKNAYRTVERIGADGRLHRVRELKTPQRVQSVKTSMGDASDVLSPKIKGTGAYRAQKTVTQHMSDGTTRQIKRTVSPDDIRMSSVRNAVNDAQYVDEVRRHGINGKSVRQVAAEQHKSVRDVIADDYAARHGVSLDNIRASRRRATEAADLSTELSAKDIGAQATSRRVKSAFRPADTGEQAFRNAEGRRILHRVTDADYRKAADLEVNGTPSIIANRRARLVEQQQQSAEMPAELRNQLVAMRAAKDGKTLQNVPIQQSANGTNVNTGAVGGFDPTMGGTRTGVPTPRSEAADTMANMWGNTKEETKHIDEMLSTTGMDKKFSETNQQAIENARAKIDAGSLDQSRASLVRKSNDGLAFTNEDSAETMICIDRYREMEHQFRAAGDTARAKEASDARDELVAVETAQLSEAGKSLQAAKMFKQLTPEGRVNSIEMMIKKIEKARGVKGITVDNDLLQQFRDATDEKVQQDLKDQIARQIWDQVPANLTEKLAAWRYMSMLLNPRTHARNIAGNGIFMPVKFVKNIIGEGVEIARGGARSKAILNPLSQADNELIKFANARWDDVATTFLEGGKKYELGMMRPEGSKIFKNTVLQKLYDANSIALNKEDEFFAKKAYSHSYAQYLKANKINPATASQDVLDKAGRYAWDEALNSTYREANALAEMINKARRGAQLSWRDIKNADNPRKAMLSKAGGTLMDALVPFAKTPANIMRNGLFYSPIGLIRGAAKIAKATTPEQQIKAIDALAQGLTGSGILALGFWAAKSGAVTGSMPTGYKTAEQRKGSYDMDRGVQEYAVTGKALQWLDDKTRLDAIAADKEYNATVDWAVPAAMPFFQGVELFNGMQEAFSKDATATDKFNTFGRIITNMSKLADPVLNLSMLSSIENAFDTYSSSGGDTGAGLTKFMTKSAQSRLGQYVPTALGQVTKSFVDENQKSATPMNSDMLGNWESFTRQQMNKIPGLSRFNADKSDAFGNKLEHKEDAKDKLLAYAKNAFSPAIIKEVRNSKADDEIQRLVKAGQSPEDLYPKKQNQSYITKAFGDKKFDINAKDVARYNEVHGQSALKGISKMVKTSRYKNATNEEKAALIKAVYDQAEKDAKKDFAMRKGMSERDYVFSTLYTDQKETYLKKEKQIKKLGISASSYAKVWQKVGDARQTLKVRNATRGTGSYITQVLAASEAKGGVKTIEQARVAQNENFSGSSWQKVVNLSKRGYKASQCAKFVLTDRERDKLAHYTRTGKVDGIDKDKLARYINNMNISQSEKWARYEVNRPKDYPNPF